MNADSLNKVVNGLGIEVVHRNATSGWWTCRCPFAPWLHDHGRDNNPSFFLHVNVGGHSGFNCFTCGQKGSVSKLAMKLFSFTGDSEHYKMILSASLLEVPDTFEDWDGIQAAESDPVPITEFEANLLLSMYPLAWEHDDSRGYLIRRGVTEKATALMGLRYDDDLMRVVFPVRRGDGKLMGLSGRSILDEGRTGPKIKDYHGLKKGQCILGIDLVQPGRPLLVVEGLFAYAHLMSLDIRDICSPVATLGSSMSKYQASILASCGVPVILLYDLGEAGDKGLYGPIDDATGKHAGGGAIDLLKGDVAVAVALYPPLVDDPDNLTREQVVEIVTTDEGAEWI